MRDPQPSAHITHRCRRRVLQPANDALAHDRRETGGATSLPVMPPDDFIGFRAAARLSGQRETCCRKRCAISNPAARVGTGVASMSEVTYDLTDSDLQALSHYLAGRV